MAETPWKKASRIAGNHNNEGNIYDVDLTLPSIVVQTICNKIAEDLDDKVSEKLAELLSDKGFPGFIRQVSC